MGMFWAADIVVKAVMIGLAIASVITWTVLVVKALELWGASASAQGRIQRAGPLEAAVAASGSRRDAVSRMIRQAADEYRRSQPALDAAGDGGVKERVQSQLERIEAVAGRRMGRPPYARGRPTACSRRSPTPRRARAPSSRPCAPSCRTSRSSRALQT